MSTRGEMLAEMADDMERTEDAAFTSKINAAIRQYQPRRFWFNESRSITFNTTASTDVYPFSAIGAEFYKVDGVYMTIADGDVREIGRVDYSYLEPLADADTTTGEPANYAYINRAIRFWRSPDATYSTRVVGHIKIDAPTSDDEADNEWMTEAYDLIMCRAKAELYAHRYEDPNNAAIMREAEGDALRRLLAVTTDKVAPTYLEATEF